MHFKNKFKEWLNAVADYFEVTNATHWQLHGSFGFRTVKICRSLSRLRLSVFLCFGLLQTVQRIAPLHAAPATTVFRDSLRRTLAATRTDTVRALLLLELCNATSDSSLLLAYRYAQQATALSEASGWLPGMVQGNIALGRCFTKAKAWQEAFPHYHAAVAAAGRARRPDLEVLAVRGMMQAIYPLPDSTAGRTDSFRKYRSRLTELLPYITDPEIKFDLGNEIAGDLYERDQLPEAIDAWRRLINTLNQEKPANPAWLGLAWHNLAGGYEAIGADDSALYALLRGRKLVADTPGNTLAFLDCALAEYYTERRQPEKALSFCWEGARLLPNKGIRGRAGLFYELLAKAHKNQQHYDSATYYYQTYISFTDSLRQADRSDEVARALMTERFMQEIAADRQQSVVVATNSRRKLQAAGFALAALALLLLLLYRNYKKSRQQNAVINDLVDTLTIQKGTIEKSLREKETLLREVHHRVNNNLQIVSALLNMQQSESTEPGVQEAIFESQTRISAIALIHNQLYRNERLESINLHPFCNQLFEQVSRVFSISRSVVLHNALPDLQLSIDVITPLGLILNELLTNSIKHVFAGKEEGTVSLTLTSAGVHEKHSWPLYTLLYKDGGPGLPADADYRQSRSLGLSLIRNLSRQLRGQFQYSADLQAFLITFAPDAFGSVKTEAV